MQWILCRNVRIFALFIALSLPIHSDVFVRDTKPAIMHKNTHTPKNSYAANSKIDSKELEQGELAPSVLDFYASIDYAIHPLPLAKNLLPQQYITRKKLPDWAYSNAILEAHFRDGDMRSGFATMMENGLFITSSEIVRDNDHTPRAIYVRMQDTSVENILCVARLNLKAVDLNSGLALLEYANSTDKYCNEMPKSYYHDRILKKYFIDVFAGASAKENEDVFFTFVDEFYYFREGKSKIGAQAEYYDFERVKYVRYGFELDQHSYKKFAYGKALFNTQGNFLGLVSMSKHSYLPTLIKKEVVQDFLCSLDERKVLQDEKIHKSCANYGTRERFF